MIKALFFDLDGTLIDSLPCFLKSYKEALEKQEIFLENKKIVDICFGKTEEKICQTLKIKSELSEFKRNYFKSVKKYCLQSKIFAGVKEVLTLAKEKQKKLAIITFSYRWYSQKIIKRLKIKNFFDLIISFEDIKNPKPHPESIFKACLKLKIKPTDAVIIGDNQSDIKMGKKAGSRTILFYPPSYKMFYNLRELKKSKPDIIISSFFELKNLLLSGL